MFPTKERSATENRDGLINEHLRQVRTIAHAILERVPKSVDLDDLISSGVIGLISAIDKFDPKKDIKLKTYAEYKIRGAILDSLRSLDWVPRSCRVRARKIESAVGALSQKLGRTPAEDEIAEALKISVEQYHKWTRDLSAANLTSLETTIPDTDGTQLQLVNTISDEEERLPSRLLERDELQHVLASGIEALSPVERTVIRLYYFEGVTLAGIAAMLKRHPSRISQIKTEAICRLRRHLKVPLPAAKTCTPVPRAA